MVYIPVGEFKYGHAEDSKTALGRKFFLKAYLIDRYEMQRGEYKKFKPDFEVSRGKGKFPVTQGTVCRSEGVLRMGRQTSADGAGMGKSGAWARRRQVAVGEISAASQ